MPTAPPSTAIEPLRAYQRDLMVRRRSPRTIQSYTESAEQLAAHADTDDLTTINREQVEAFLLDQIEKHSPATAAVRFRSLRAMFNWMVDEDLIVTSPMVKMSPPTVVEAPVPVIDDDRLRDLLRACEGKGFEQRRDTAMVRLFCEPGGPRLAEMTGITLDDLDLRRDEVLLHGKGSKDRIIPFGGKTGQALERYLRLRRVHPMSGRTNRLWLGQQGSMTASGISQMLRRRGGTAGIPRLHPHQLRHTSAHVWLASGGSEGQAMRLFGWSSREMLARYGASAADERAREAARAASLGDRL